MISASDYSAVTKTGAYVEDADAYGGKAACYTMSANKLQMRYYCNDGEMTVGNLTFADMASTFQVDKLMLPQTKFFT